MAKKVILHVGTHKTGTSSIQSAFDGYDDGKVRYADLGFINHSVPIYTAFCDDVSSYRPHIMAARDACAIQNIKNDTLEKLALELARPVDILVISGEDICAMAEAELIRLRGFIIKICDSINVISYVRDPVGYASSSTQNLINTNHLIADLHICQYRATLEKFYSVFGEDNVEVVEYNPSYFPDRSVIAHFCDYLGVIEKPVEASKENVSLSENAIRLLWRFNSTGVPAYAEPRLKQAFSSVVDHLERHMPGPKFQIPDDIVYNKVCDDDLHWLEVKTGISFFLTKREAEASEKYKSFEEFILDLDDEWTESFDDRESPYLRTVEVTRQPEAFVNALFVSFLLQQWDNERTEIYAMLEASQDTHIKASRELDRVQQLIRSPWKYVSAYVKYKLSKSAAKLPYLSEETTTNLQQYSKVNQPFF